MPEILFGTAGIPHSSASPSTAGGISRIAEIGLDAMEVEFVRGVHMSVEAAAEVDRVRKETGVRLTVHAPYFINLNSKEKEKVQASRDRIIKSARIASVMGAESVVFHAAFYQGVPASQVFDKVLEELKLILHELKDISVLIRPETTGKASQFGDIDELISVSKKIPGIQPCVDFAHVHARSGGGFNSYGEFCDLLRKLKGGLGAAALMSMHIHVSGIKYGAKGELTHLDMRESDFNYRDLLRALHDFKAAGILICESPNLEEDAMMLQEEYRKINTPPA